MSVDLPQNVKSRQINHPMNEMCLTFIFCRISSPTTTTHFSVFQEKSSNASEKPREQTEISVGWISKKFAPDVGAERNGIMTSVMTRVLKYVCNLFPGNFANSQRILFPPRKPTFQFVQHDLILVKQMCVVVFIVN